MMNGQWKEWQPGDPVLINRIVWGQPEIDQLQDVLDNDWFGPGQKVATFAKVLSDFIGIDHIQPVNSGSTALKLAVEAMLAMDHWKAGDWILHPLLTFPTSIVPAIKAGLKPIFVDVELGTYQIDLDQVAKALKEHGDKIKGAIIPHLLGNVCDLHYLIDMLDGRPLIEDCCDTIGSTYDDLHVGAIGEVAAFSFYGSHHVTTGGVGGALATNREDIYDYAKSATHWGRNDYSLLGDDYERFSKRYWYETLGSDYQMTELQAAFGVVQMARVRAANKLRERRFREIDHHFKQSDAARYFYLPYTDTSVANPSWFCYPLTIKPEAPFSRKEFATHLMGNNIEIRPLFTGNVLRHPAFKQLPPVRIDSFDNTNADLIGDNGLFLPAWGMSERELDYMLSTLTLFFGRYSRGLL